ncbi:MAG: LacI family DNA-binding transcriptional regulator [Acidimicrobiales bacterium]
MSLRDVAKLSGVSVATASRALNADSSHPVSDETRARVRSAAEQLDFRHNALARGLQARRSQTLALLVHDIRDPYFSEIARGVGDAAAEAGFATLICNTDRNAASELAYVRMLRENRVAGLLFAGGQIEDGECGPQLVAEVAAIADYGGAVVALGPRSDPWAAEIPDNEGGAYAATRHLLTLGHRRIAFIDGPEGLRTSRERRAGHARALAEAGLALDAELLVAGGYTVEGGAWAVAQLLEARSFTAVFASDDVMAIGCAQELRRRGLSVPNDVSLVGFDDIPVVAWLDPALTTVAVPMEEIGIAGVRRMARLLSREEGAQKTPALDGPEGSVRLHASRLVVRSSTAPPARSGVATKRQDRDQVAAGHGGATPLLDLSGGQAR